MDIKDKLADLIVTLLGTGFGWFFANKVYYRFKRGKFEFTFVDRGTRDDLGDYIEKEVYFTVKNVSHIDCYNIQFSAIFNDRKANINESFHLISKYEAVNFTAIFQIKKSEQQSPLSSIIDFLEIEFTTQYGYTDRQTNSRIRNFTIDDLPRRNPHRRAHVKMIQKIALALGLSKN